MNLWDTGMHTRQCGSCTVHNVCVCVHDRSMMCVGGARPTHLLVSVKASEPVHSCGQPMRAAYEGQAGKLCQEYTVHNWMQKHTAMPARRRQTAKLKARQMQHAKNTSHSQGRHAGQSQRTWQDSRCSMMERATRHWGARHAHTGQSMSMWFHLHVKERKKERKGLRPGDGVDGCCDWGSQWWR